MAQEGSRRSEGVRRRRPFVVAYNALHVRPGVYDGAATFSLNVVQRLPEVLPDARIVAYVAEGEDRLEPRPNLELRPVGEGRVHAPGRVALETLWLTVDLRRIGASALISPHESIPLRAPAPVVVVAQNLVYHRHGLGDAFVGRERRDRFRSNLSARYYRRRMAEAYTKAAAVVAVSGHTADMLVEHSQLDRSKTVVVHEGSDSMFLGSPEVPETRRSGCWQCRHSRLTRISRPRSMCLRGCGGNVPSWCWTSRAATGEGSRRSSRSTRRRQVSARRSTSSDS